MPDILQDNIIVYHKGKLSYDIIGELIQELKSNMSKRNVRFGLYKKLLTLMIETLENVIRYHENLDNKDEFIESHPPEFQISFQDPYYILMASNAVLRKDALELTKKFDELNSMDKKEIKELYKETITNGEFSEKGGAGLGMIEMAKLADKKLEYELHDIDTELMYFTLRLILKSAVMEK